MTDELVTIPLWPNGIPNVVPDAPEPTLTEMFPPEDSRCGASIVICPGGGYCALAEHEAEPIGEWLNSLGVCVWILRYRLYPHYQHPCMLQDAQHAIRTVKARSEELRLDPNRVGILGFSAGGHLAATAATHFDAGDPGSSDPIARASSRPDLAILIYPVITMQKPYRHEGSYIALLGEHPTPDLVDHLSNEKQVSKNTPPIALYHTADDGVAVENSILMATALSAAKVDFELHIYQQGGHGYGLAKHGQPFVNPWTTQCAHWLSARGFLKPANPA